MSLALEIIPPELLEYASDDELIVYYEYLEAISREQGDWTLQPRQLVAERMTHEGGVYELLYGGAAGGGKSDWLLKHFYDLALEHPGFNGLLLRRTFPALRRSLILRSWERFDRDVCRYVATDHTWRFENGSQIEFGYCERDQDVYQYQSAEYDCVGWDELTQFPTEFPYLYLMSRCRTTVQKQIRGLTPHIVAGTNPGNIGGAWVKARFVDPAPPGTPFEVTLKIEGQAPRRVTRVFVPAKLTDNRFIDADTYRMGLANLPEDYRRALEEGSWDVVEGQYFKEWSRGIHVVAPFELPAWWRRIGGLDYGHAAPFCHLTLAFDGDGTAWVYREHYKAGLTPVQQAQLILQTEMKAREHIAYRLADPSVWVNTGAGPPIAQQYRDAGLIVRKANNARVDGWARMRDYLRVGDGTGQPRLKVFSTCRDLIRTLPMLVHDGVHPEDLDSDGEDHAADALRYALMSQPLRSQAPARPPRTVEERMAERTRQRRRARDSGNVEHPVLGRLSR